MKNTTNRVAVTSRSFSRHPVLRAELEKRYENVTFNDEGLRLVGDALIDYLKGHDMAITALERLDGDVFEALPELKTIGKYGVGLDMIDLRAMEEHDVKIGWTAGVNKRAVAELTLTMMISLIRSLPAAYREVQSGGWKQIVGRQLTDMTVGIIGCGHIGKDLVQLLKPFGCQILVHDIKDYSDFYQDHGITALGLEEVLSKADVVTLHVPLDGTTRNLINRERLGLMKETAILINAARGGLIDEKALYKMLSTGKILGAGFDVYAVEPPKENPLIDLPNVLTTPHIGGSSEEAIIAMGMAAINGLESAGDPLSLLSD